MRVIELREVNWLPNRDRSIVVAGIVTGMPVRLLKFYARASREGADTTGRRMRRTERWRGGGERALVRRDDGRITAMNVALNRKVGLV